MLLSLDKYLPKRIHRRRIHDSPEPGHREPARIMPSARGQGLAEYALILALIAIVAIVALIFLGGQVSKILSTVGHSV